MHLIYSTCPTVYVNKHLSCLTYGRVPTKGCNYIRTQNLRIENIYMNTVSKIRLICPVVISGYNI